VIGQPNKTGFIHYLDAKTGKFLEADKFADKVNWTTGIDSSGRPMNVIGLPEEGGAKVEVWPGLLGTVNMYPNAYNPKTGLFYSSASDYGMMYGIEPVKVISNVRQLGASWDNINGPEIDQAWNPATGKEAWRIQRDKPGYAGGILTTAGNLTVFTTQGGAVPSRRCDHRQGHLWHGAGDCREIWAQHIHGQWQADDCPGGRRPAGRRP
jgi:glucose dehydrogenase